MPDGETDRLEFGLISALLASPLKKIRTFSKDTKNPPEIKGFDLDRPQNSAIAVQYRAETWSQIPKKPHLWGS
jgi:hypothetical protein